MDMLDNLHQVSDRDYSSKTNADILTGICRSTGAAGVEKQWSHQRRCARRQAGQDRRPGVNLSIACSRYRKVAYADICMHMTMTSDHSVFLAPGLWCSYATDGTGLEDDIIVQPCGEERHEVADDRDVPALLLSRLLANRLLDLRPVVDDLTGLVAITVADHDVRGLVDWRAGLDALSIQLLAFGQPIAYKLLIIWQHG